MSGFSFVPVTLFAQAAIRHSYWDSNHVNTDDNVYCKAGTVYNLDCF